MKCRSRGGGSVPLTVSTLAVGLMCIGTPGAAAASPQTPAGPVTGSLAQVGEVAPTITVLRFGSFETDSALEVDRSFNAATGGSGTVGSDREGGPGD